MRSGKARWGWWMALAVAGCAGRAAPAVEQAAAGPVVVPASVPAPASPAGSADAPAAAVPDVPKTPPAAPAPDVPGPERRINWHGLSLDLSDVWSDATSYTFAAPSESLYSLVFDPSSLEPAQVRPWLQEVRRRVDGVYGAKPSGVQPYENPNHFVLGLEIPYSAEFMYHFFVTVDDRVVSMTARCRSQCDVALRRIVRSLRKQPALGTGPAQELQGKRRRYSARGLFFDSSIVFDTPNRFSLTHIDDDVERRIFCRRQPQPPADAELPPDVHWSSNASQALAKAPRLEETLTGKSSDARAAVVRLYRREASASDGGVDNVPFSSTSAVVAIGSEFLHCFQLAGPTSPELTARFRRLFESARYE